MAGHGPLPKTYIRHENLTPAEAMKKPLSVTVEPRNDEMVKAAELIEIRGLSSLTLNDRKIYDLLLRNAHGADLAKTESRYTIRLSQLRHTGNHANSRIKESLLRLMGTIVEVHSTDGVMERVSQIALLGKNTMVDKVKRKPSVSAERATRSGWLEYQLDPELALLLGASRRWARLNMSCLLAIKSGYSYALYQQVSALLNRDRQYETVPLEIAREQWLGVSPGKLKGYAQLKATALERAVSEVNAVAPFNVGYHEIKVGRRVTQLAFYWEHKTTDQLKSQYSSMQGPREASMQLDLPLGPML